MARKNQISIRVAPDALTRLRVVAKREKRSVSFLIDQAIEDFLAHSPSARSASLPARVPLLRMRYAPLIDTAILYAYSAENPKEFAAICGEAGVEIQSHRMEYSALLNGDESGLSNFFTLANLVSLRNRPSNAAPNDNFAELPIATLTWKAHFLFVNREYLDQNLPRDCKNLIADAGPHQSLCRILANKKGHERIYETFQDVKVACESNTDWEIALGMLGRKYDPSDENSIFQPRHCPSIRSAFDQFIKGNVPAFGGDIVHTALLLKDERFRSKAVVVAAPAEFDCPSTSTIVAPTGILNKYRPVIVLLWESAAKWFNEKLVKDERTVRSVLHRLYPDDPILAQADPEVVRQLLLQHVRISTATLESPRQAIEKQAYENQIFKQFEDLVPTPNQVKQ